MRVALLVLLATAASTRADVRAIPILEELTGAMQYEVTYGFEPARCTKLLDRLRDLQVPQSTTITLSRPTRFLANGTHALPAVERACQALEHAARIERVRVVLRYAVSQQDAEPCVTTWRQARRAGVAASEMFDEEIRVRGKPVRVTGSLAQLVHKHCIPQHARALARRAARHAAYLAPYQRRLRNDKLRYIAGYMRVVLRGGDRSRDPARLAAARVWFFENRIGDERCADGRVRTRVTRLTFDGDHRLRGHSFHDYCGGSVFE